MENVDKVLAAEETIRGVAEELQKMQNAARLMDGAQQKVDAVLQSSDAVIKQTEQFVKEGTEIVQKIGYQDIEQDLSTAISSLEKLSTLTEGMQSDLSDLATSVGEVAGGQESKITELKSELADINKTTDQNNKSLNRYGTYFKTLDSMCGTISDNVKKVINYQQKELDRVNKHVTWLFALVGINILIGIASLVL